MNKNGAICRNCHEKIKENHEYIEILICNSCKDEFDIEGIYKDIKKGEILSENLETFDIEDYRWFEYEE